MSVNVYELVTNRILSQLEEGIIPWERPWGGARGGAYNRITKHPYSLINQMILTHEGEYASFKQWKQLDGKIKKGAKSEIIVFWKMLQVEDKNDKGETIKKNVPLLRYYNVFHISDVEGVKPLESHKLNNSIEPIEEAEKVLASYLDREHIKLIQETNNKAYYSPMLDLIHLPVLEQFKNVEEYYSTAFHEATHSTGHKTRLARLREGLEAAHFGSENYSKEELVAEIGAATILNLLGIENPHSFRNNVAYIQNWLQVLQNDSKFIISASSKAEKAVNYIMGVEA